MLKKTLDWRDILEHPYTVLITGRRGSGKTGLGFYLLDRLGKEHRLPAYVMGLPKQKWNLLPNHIKGLELGADLPESSVIFVDEAAMALYAREHAKSLNKQMNLLLSVSRQRDQTVIFASHTARKLDVGIVMDMDCLAFKEPSRLYARFERSEIREMAQHSLKTFERMDKKQGLRSSVVYTHKAFGLVVENPLPPFWCEELSRGFAGITLGPKPRDMEREILQNILNLERSGGYDSRFGWEMHEVKGLTGGHIAKFLSQGLIRRGYTSGRHKHFYGNTKEIEERLGRR